MTAFGRAGSSTTAAQRQHTSEQIGDAIRQDINPVAHLEELIAQMKQLTAAAEQVLQSM